MELVDKRVYEEERKYFNELPLGTVYADSQGKICIKTDNGDYHPNCLYFCDNQWKSGNEDIDEVVTVLNAKLIIEN